MGVLIDAFCDAIKEWASESGREEKDATLYVMMYTGGWYYVDKVINRIDGINFESLSEKDRREIIQLVGHHTLQQMKSWLESLVTQTHISEKFLIHSLIKFLDDEFERDSENYGRGIAKRRELKKELELGDEPAQELDRADQFLLSMLQAIASSNKNPLEEQRELRVISDTWRKVMAPVLEMPDPELSV